MPESVQGLTDPVGGLVSKDLWAARRTCPCSLQGPGQAGLRRNPPKASRTLLDLCKRTAHKTLHSETWSKDLRWNPPKALWDPALLDLFQGTCDLQGLVHVAQRDLCKCRRKKGPVQECRTRPRPQGTPAALDLYKGTCDPRGLSVFAARRTLRGKCRRA